MLQMAVRTAIQLASIVDPGTRAARSVPVSRKQLQSGVALLAMLTLLTLWGLYLFLGQLSARQLQMVREQSSAAAMASARETLIGDAISARSGDTPRPSINDAGYLRLPDLGTGIGGAPAEGGAAGVLTDSGKDLSVIGKFPWKTLATEPLRDAQGECLWYVVAGRFQIAPKTDAPMNWDTQGQIDIIDRSGRIIARNLVALIVAPGEPVDGQSRGLTDPTYEQCGGNYDARNYLDAFDLANAIANDVNYFPGSTNNRLASDTINKQFVVANTGHYNDRFLSITVDEIFDRVIRRSDFATAIANLLDDPDLRKRAETGHPETVAVSSGAGKEKGTDNLIGPNNLICNYIADLNNREFCRNWWEMLFLTQLSTPSRITIDGNPAPLDCNRVLIFAGRKAGLQTRSSVPEKRNKENYLESPNLASFSVPSSTSSNFGGVSVFDWRNPGADIVRCLP